MCTVSYFPTTDGFILTSNRDEDPARKTLAPRNVVLPSGHRIIAPIDTNKKGSWIATNGNSKTACLLNGGFRKHLRLTSYKKSRGVVLLDAFVPESFEVYMEQVVLDGIEPFTLILVEENTLFELVWDGIKKHISKPDPGIPHLWSSVTLYDDEQHREKLLFFKEYIKRNPITPEQILDLHGLYSDNVFVINREIVRTVSTTQVVHKEGKTTLSYMEKENTNENHNANSIPNSSELR